MLCNNNIPQSLYRNIPSNNKSQLITYTIFIISYIPTYISIQKYLMELCYLYIFIVYYYYHWILFSIYYGLNGKTVFF